MKRLITWIFYNRTHAGSLELRFGLKVSACILAFAVSMILLSWGIHSVAERIVYGDDHFQINLAMSGSLVVVGIYQLGRWFGRMDLEHEQRIEAIQMGRTEDELFDEERRKEWWRLQKAMRS